MDIAAIVKNGAPYPSLTAQLGLTPSTDVDVPVSCVFLVLYILAAASHMTIFQVNRRKGHKFIPSVIVFGFCMMRNLTCCLRIGSAYKPTNVSLGIASGIFVNAGVLALFVLDLLFAQRCLRAAFPRFGWTKLVHNVFLVNYLLIPCVLIMVIVTTVYAHYTLDSGALKSCRDALLAVSSYMVFFSLLPLALAIGIAMAPKGTDRENFGTGSFAAKLWIVGVTSFLLCLGATFRAAVNFMPPRPATNPYSFQGRACFYIFYFTLEVLVVYTFLFTRIDKRFWIPNGSRGTYLVDGLAKETSEETFAEDKPHTI
ncbi:hypothetical protein TMatcc_010110 [Talaromyces marneffei ATCC 18224]|uniref:Integral membrane protein n=2 Tax=Talaromyces marneffei TaxID=37727 RepID=B6QU04_TALMQ|nr:uncharacterized protein EYB26_009310 [Talaromyces marneffei]EEA19964.1 conserved hypothetical protein [Talaromyces marneffei ATCC 18224]KAE8548254.1 hypothetical protein EYB25_010048 [Talaromyces marneffei]QGA21599.1 hypothetical protein EYB26_009310 [Talaromyces marneffei]